MASDLILSDITDEDLDWVLGLPFQQKNTYFNALIKKHYPAIPQEDKRYNQLLENYLSSFYVEKLYRSNRFFHEKFLVTYTHTGLVRNVINELYFTDDDLITH
jgi:hypothetical protein